MGSLADGMRAFSKQAKIDIDEVARTVLFNISNGAINDTPVDSGRARSNWFASTGSPIRKILKTGRRDPLKNVNEKIITAIQNGKKYYLSNNLPYIEALEYGLYPKNPVLGSRVRGSRPARYEIRTTNGYSKQARKGMLRLNIVRQKNKLNQYLNSDKIKTGGSGKRWS